MKTTMKLDYDTLHYLTFELIDKIDNSILETIDYIASPSRGGLLPGLIISKYLKKPFIPIMWSNEDISLQHHNGFLAEKLYTGANILLVDDLNDSGKTLIEITKDLMYDDPNPNVPAGRLYTAAVFQRYNTKFSCGFYAKLIEDDRWIQFPYEGL